MNGLLERWLKAPIINNSGELRHRNKGTPQGGVISPLLSNLFLHYVFDVWLTKTHPNIPWSRGPVEELPKNGISDNINLTS